MGRIAAAQVDGQSLSSVSVCRRERGSEHEALAAFTTERLQVSELCAVFDAFGDDADPKSAREGDGRVDDDLAPQCLEVHGGDEPTVDLQRVDRVVVDSRPVRSGPCFIRVPSVISRRSASAVRRPWRSHRGRSWQARVVELSTGEVHAHSDVIGDEAGGSPGSQGRQCDAEDVEPRPLMRPVSSAIGMNSNRAPSAIPMLAVTNSSLPSMLNRFSSALCTGAATGRLGR